MATQKRKPRVDLGKPLMEVLAEACAPRGSLMETSMLIMDAVQTIRWGLQHNGDAGDQAIITDANGNEVMLYDSATIDRIVACVNFCAGIPTEVLNDRKAMMQIMARDEYGMPLIWTNDAVHGSYQTDNPAAE